MKIALCSAPALRIDSSVCPCAALEARADEPSMGEVAMALS
ncbi:hypothetical protein [Sphingomonas oligophenolica]